MTSLILHKYLCPQRWVQITVLLLSLVTSLFAQVGEAQTTLSGITLSADNMSRDGVKNIVILKGNVQVVFQENHLSADHAVINLNRKTIDAKGNVVIRNPETYSEADRLAYNYESKTGVLYNGFVQSGQVVFEGNIVEKVGEKEYIASKAHFTACATCPPAWSFSGTRIAAEIGGYADIKYPILRVGGYPVLILPRIIVPLKSQRQSGLLEPTMEFGTDSGFALGMPYFWAISRSQDATITPKYYSQRGFKLLGEYRYVLSPQSKGTLRGGFLQDEIFPKDESLDNKPQETKNSLDRGFLDYSHYYLLPNDYIQRTQVKHVSDLRYVRDFSEELEGHGDPALENRFSLTKNTEKSHLSVDAAVYTNLLQTDPYADNKEAVHRLPEIRYNLMEQRVLDSDLLFGLKINYVNFVRNGFAYDDVQNTGNTNQPKEIKSQRDGEFDPSTDLLRTGHRLDISPSLALPFQLGRVIDIMPEVIYRETQYYFNADAADPTADYTPSAARRYLQADLAMRTQFNSIFSMGSELTDTRWKHSIEPEVRFSSIPWIRHPDHPFFGNFEEQPHSRTFEKITDQDFFNDQNKIQFDYEDRVFEKRLVNFALTNHLVRKRWGGNEASYRRIATFRLDQSYDLIEASKENPRPWSPINALLNLRLNHFETHTTATYFPYGRVANTSSRVRILDSVGNFAEVSYTESFTLDKDYNYDFDKRIENLGFGLGYVSKYFNLTGKIKYSLVNKGVQSWEYIATFLPPGKCWGIQLGHSQQIGNDDIKFKFNFNFEFGGG